MKTLLTLMIFLLMPLHVNATTLHLASIPADLSVQEALLDLEQAAIQRGWEITERGKDSLTIVNDSNLYRSRLVFFIDATRISYVDKTKRFSHTSYNQKVFKDYSIPENWIRNLKYDVTVFMHRRAAKSIKAVTSTEQPIEVIEAQRRLRGLKKMLDEKLISQKEYQTKKQDILSRY